MTIGWGNTLSNIVMPLLIEFPYTIPPGGVPTKNVDEYNNLARLMHEALYVRWKSPPNGNDSQRSKESC